MTRADALEFTYERNEKGVLRVAAWGRVEKGDTAKFLAFAKRESARFLESGDNFHLSSPGGDYLEAIRLGKLLRDAQVTVWVDGPCASACAIIFFSATKRLALEPKGKIGLHRVSFPKEQLARLSPAQADALYATTLIEVRKHLELLEVPREYQEIMLSTPSWDIHWLTWRDLLNIPAPTWYDELVRAKCGNPSAASLTDAEVARAAAALECEEKLNLAARKAMIGSR